MVTNEQESVTHRHIDYFFQINMPAQENSSFVTKLTV